MAYAYKTDSETADWYNYNSDTGKWRKISTANGSTSITEVSSLPSGTSSITQSEFENTLCAAIYAYANPSGAGLRIGTRPTIVIR